MDVSLNGCLVSGNAGTAVFRIKDKLTVVIILGEEISIEVSAHIVFTGEDMQIGFSV